MPAVNNVSCSARKHPKTPPFIACINSNRWFPLITEDLSCAVFLIHENKPLFCSFPLLLPSSSALVQNVRVEEQPASWSLWVH